MNWPDESVQGVLGEDWWVQDTTRSLCRGRLVWTLVPYWTHVPFIVDPERKDDNEHHTARLRVREYSPGTHKKTALPVASLTRQDQAERFLIMRSKERPAIVLSTMGRDFEIKKTAMKGKPTSRRLGAFTVAPYFGSKKGKQEKYPEPLVSRVRRCFYPQLFWDQLPLKGADESLLRLDMMQPMGVGTRSYRITTYRLSQSALEIMNTWTQWYLTGYLPEDSLLDLMQQDFREL